MKKGLFNPKNLHHAYFISGERENAREIIFSFLKNDLKENIKGNPDLSIAEYETFGIEDARSVTERQEKMSFSEGRKIFVISFNFITREAQNALLKTLEEPTPNTHFFITAPGSAMLLPTLRSRLSFVSFDETVRESDEVKKFLKASPDVRLKIMEKFKDAENETKKSELLFFLDEIEKELGGKTLSKENASVLKELLELKKYLFDRAPSVKMIAEYLALRLPQM